MSDDSKVEQKALACPVCQSNKAMIAGENVKLGGKFEDKEFLTLLQFDNDLLIPIILYFFDKFNHKI